MDWPVTWPDALIELKCWKRHKEAAYKGNVDEPWEFFWRGIGELLPAKDFTRHRWAEQHVYDWTTEDFLIVWGCASAGKSNDFGLITLVDWMVDPTETVSVLASTTLNMLKLRSFESVQRYLSKLQRLHPDLPGKLSKTTTAVLLDDKKDGDHLDVTDKASVRGVAVSDGTEEEATAKLRGAHLPYVRLILDELSQMKPAAMAVRTNMAIGAKDFKLVGLTNPDSFKDLASQFSVPVQDGGFASLDPDKDFVWRSRYGKVRRHDGLKSPAIVEENGAEKYPFLLTQTVLDRIIEQEGGLDSPGVATMVRAWPRATGKSQTLIGMDQMHKYRAFSDCIWRDVPQVTVLGVDPAFSAAGNRGVMQALDIGVTVEGRFVLSFHKERPILLKNSAKDPILTQVGNQVADYVKELGIRDGRLIGVDDSSTQSLADFLQHEFHLKVQRFSASHRPLDAPLTKGDPETAKDRYYNQGIELWAALAAFVRTGQIKNMPRKAAEQITERPTEEDKRPIRLVSKKKSAGEGGYNSGESPDEMDACSYAIGIARYVLHLVAGADSIPVKYSGNGATSLNPTGDFKGLAKKHDLDSRAYAE